MNVLADAPHPWKPSIGPDDQYLIRSIVGYRLSDETFGEFESEGDAITHALALAKTADKEFAVTIGGEVVWRPTR